MNKDTKKQVMTKHQAHAKDTGSTAVQIAILTAKIKGLTEHMKVHHKDNHSRKGLLGMVGRRSKLLRYLKMNNKDQYTGLIGDLGLRK